MSLDFFIEGPLLRFVFLLLLAGLSIRVIFFLRAILVSAHSRNAGWGFVLVSLARSFLTFHMGVKKKPLYASLRYLFHSCLFVVPVFLFAHVALWEASRFEWTWTTLPDVWADRLTLLVSGLCLLFLARRIIVPEVRRSSSLTDFLLIILASLPFLTGYLLSHGMPKSLVFWQRNMWTLHVLCGEALLLTVPFLFCRIRLKEAKCTGCAACVLRCPTATLRAVDRGTERVFLFSHYQCICCGSCVGTCPEGAAELRHKLSLRKILPKPAGLEIRSVRLEACGRCSALFVPEPQLREILATVTEAYPRLCPKCRERNLSNIVSGLAISQKRPRGGIHET